MAYGNNNSRGGYGNRQGGGGGFRGGSNRSGGFNRGGNGGGDSGKYLRSSSFTKTIIDDKSNNKERVNLEIGLTEEVAISLTADKAQDLLKRVQDAINDQQGDGGVRITLYCQHKTNKDTGEEFDGASLLIVGKFPPKDVGQNRGGFNGSRGGNGRRDYPDQAASSDTQSRGQTSRGDQTQDSRSDGNTNNATKGASPSNEEYTEQSGW